MELSKADPKGLVRESYAIDGITLGECRSIFIDWALSVPVGVDTAEALRSVLAHYMPGNENHPMTSVLTEALVAPAAPRRKGGRMGRVGA
jgi:hypothetical protein